MAAARPLPCPAADIAQRVGPITTRRPSRAVAQVAAPDDVHRGVDPDTQAVGRELEPGLGCDRRLRMRQARAPLEHHVAGRYGRRQHEPRRAAHDDVLERRDHIPERLTHHPIVQPG